MNTDIHCDSGITSLQNSELDKSNPILSKHILCIIRLED